MRSLGAEGKTVLVSSHILGEVEQVADRVSIIGRGRLITSGTVRDVIGKGTVSGLRVGVADVVAATKVLVDSGLTVAAEGSLLRVDGVADGARSPGGSRPTTCGSTSSSPCWPTSSRCSSSSRRTRA